ncbi:hypothetical protein Q5752_000044 [Cryptotrichosporon argae]
MEAELQTYRDQLAYVNLQLETDGTNADLVSLKDELVELISLTEAALGPTAGGSKGKGKARDDGRDAAEAKGKEDKSREGEGAGAWQETGEYRAGMDCMAKYKDGKFYPARVNAVIGSRDSPLYTITFKGYTTSTNVPLASLRPHDPTAPVPTPDPSKRPAELSERDKEKKKKKGEKWVESQKAKADEVKGKKNAWEKFGKKAAKKGIHISGLEGKSVFRTPDNPFGRVGVVGSGQGMTQYERTGKHKFDTAVEE